MKYNIQKFKHDPENGVWGDCFRTAISCLLDLKPEDVPHFMHGFPEDANEQAKLWLNDKGYSIFFVAYEAEFKTLMKFMGQNNKDIYYIFTGKSSRGVPHAFVGLNDKIVHDPSGRGETEPTGPCDDGLYWIEVLVPLQVCDVAKS